MVDEILDMIIDETGETVKAFLELIGRYHEGITIEELNDIFTKYKIRRLIFK